MKRFLVVLGLLLIGLSAVADVYELETVGDMKTFWDNNGRREQKVLEVGTKIINANKLDKRIPIQMNRDLKTINANSCLTNKTVVVYYGILPYFDNDDELAYVLGHEIAHSIDAYDGPVKWVNMKLNSQQYEHKADLIGIDLMTKAGYNPLAAITCANKWMPEITFNFGIFTTHPKTSKRLIEMYKYIYVKYPWALKTDMANNVNYQNFLNSSTKEREEFLRHQKERYRKQNFGDL